MCSSVSLRLLHPLMPFLTEELWHAMGYGADADSIMTAPWPTPLPGDQLAAWGADVDAVDYVDAKHELIRAGRALRQDYGIAAGRKIGYLIRPANADAAERLRADTASLSSLLRAETLEIDPELEPGSVMPSVIVPMGTIYLPLEGLIDVEAERTRLTGQVAEVEKHLSGVLSKLSNSSFVEKAPEHVVSRQRELQVELEGKRAKLQGLLEALA